MGFGSEHEFCLIIQGMKGNAIMAEIKPGTLKLALHNVWEENGNALFEQKGADEVSGDDVRKFVRFIVDEQPLLRSAVRRFWHSQSTKTKTAALLLAFPKRYYFRFEDDRTDVVTRFKVYLEVFEEIRTLVGDKRTLKADGLARARKLLKEIKENLRRDIKQCEKHEGQLSSWEANYLLPALREASGRIRVSWNSHPIKSRWHSELYAARDDLEYMLRQLEAKDVENAKSEAL